jgi:hypothetical protein
VSFSNVKGGYPGLNNLNADPRFYVNGDYHVLSNSPCIDSGSSNGAPNGDLDGTARPQGAGFDMGAHEYADQDGDGLPDWWELKFSGNRTNMVATADLDGDGVDAWGEYVAGSDPNVGVASLEISSIVEDSAGQFLLSWHSMPFRLYRLERWTNLQTAAVTLSNDISATPPTNSFLDTLGSTVRAFWRVTLLGFE